MYVQMQNACLVRCGNQQSWGYIRDCHTKRKFITSRKLLQSKMVIIYFIFS